MSNMSSNPKKTNLQHSYAIKLSPYANLFYVEWLIAPESHFYNVVMDKLLYGSLDVKRLHQAVERYVNDHIVLNSHIQEIKGIPHWVENENVNALSYVDHVIGTATLLNYVRAPFDVHVGPLYRFKLIRIRPKLYRFIVVFHHLVVDGSCLDNGLFETLSYYYNDQAYSIMDKKTQIDRLISLEMRLTNTLKLYKTNHYHFWKEALTNLEKISFDFLTSNHTIEKNHPKPPNNPIKEVRFSYQKAVLSKLKKIKIQYGITPYVYGLCIFALLLYRYIGQERFAISYPIAIKEARQFIYGAQLNINVIPFHFSAELTIDGLFKTTSLFFDAIKHDSEKNGYYPIASIVQFIDKSFLDTCFIQTNLRDTPFIFDGIDKICTLTELHVDSVNESTFLFEQECHNNQLQYRVRYNQNHFHKEFVQQFVAAYKRLFLEILNEAVIVGRFKPISAYQLLSRSLHEKVVYQFNAHYKNYSNAYTIHEIFEAQVRRTPDNIAIIFGTVRLSYRELNDAANRLSRYLLRFYITHTSDLVVLCLDKNEYLMIAILAVLKAGGAYVPLDPNYPDDRINYIVTATKTKLILTNYRYHFRFKENKEVARLFIDSAPFHAIIRQESRFNLTPHATGNDLCYILYTSGTTGTPKGVLQTHQNVLSLFHATNDLYHFNTQDVWVLFHSYIFDFSVWEIWGALLYGGRLIIPTIEQTMNPHLFYQLCYFEKVTVLNQTPQVFYQFEEVLKHPMAAKKLLCLRYVIFGGDKLDFSALKLWLTHYTDKKPKLINMYGITETTIHTTYKFIRYDDIGRASIIGKPISDQTVYVLDRFMKPLPIDVIGELYVGGAGLANGYLNCPTLTRERFIKNPFQTAEEKKHGYNAILYKTGDLVRWLPTGEIEYIGRNDSQVKIKGCRVELDEIKNNLLRYEGIEQAVIVSKNRYANEFNADARYLIAYYVSKKLLNDVDMARYLATQLPDYMCPRIYIHLKAMPLTINGKIDYPALPEPKFQVNIEYQPPENKKEVVICNAFSTVLGIKPIGVSDDFFELGGDSLSAIQLASLLQRHFPIKVSDIFNCRTPKHIAHVSSFSGDVLRQTLEQVKRIYNTEKTRSLSSVMERKKRLYLSSVRRLKMDCKTRQSISNVLLTGATGYLGCNLLHNLLEETNYKIFVLVRANTDRAAIERIKKKYHFYFDQSIKPYIEKRLIVIRSDIEKKRLGLRKSNYEHLASQIDSIIHTAALVKHYGSESIFYSANVKATIQMLKFSKQARKRYFHYISTISVLDVEAESNTYMLYTEDDLPVACIAPNNIYIRTKLQAERQVISYRKKGIKTNIYRIGNLALMRRNYRLQENKDENAFYNWIKCLLQMKCFTKELSQIELSPVDDTAEAIIRLFDKQALLNHIFHVLNPHHVDLQSIFPLYKGLEMAMVSMDTFIDKLFKNLKSSHFRQLTLKLLLRQGWLDGKNTQNFSADHVLQQRTDKILKQLNFEWPLITTEVFNHYVNMVLE